MPLGARCISTGGVKWIEGDANRIQRGIYPLHFIINHLHFILHPSLVKFHKCIGQYICVGQWYKVDTMQQVPLLCVWLLNF